MTIKLKTWTQTEFERAGISTFHKDGDFYSASGLFPTRNRLQMRRGPDWSSLDTDVLGTDVIDPRTLFYNPQTAMWCFLGTDTGKTLQVAKTYDLDDQFDHFELSTSHVLPGGRPLQNVAVTRDYLYLVLDDGKIYYATQDVLEDWDISAGAIQAGGSDVADVAIITHIAGDLYAIDKDCTVYRSTSETALATIYEPNLKREPLAAIAYREKLHVFIASQHNNLDVIEISLPGDTTNKEDADPTMSFPCGQLSPLDLIACQHNGLIYFATGRHVSSDVSFSASWTNPSDVHDPDGEWTDDDNAKNGSAANYAHDTVAASSWSSYLYFDIFDSIDALKFYVGRENSAINRVQVDVLAGGVWRPAYDSEPAMGVGGATYFGFPPVVPADQVRIRAYNSDGGSSYDFRVNYLQYNDAANTYQSYNIDIYTYDADNSPNHITNIELADQSYNIGFLPWNGELIFYVLEGPSGSVDHHFKLLLDEGSVDLATLTASASSEFQPLTYANHNTIIVTGSNGTNDGHYHADLDSLSDGHIITSRLDFGSPHQIKRLNSITALLDDCATDFDVTISYRLDDATSWTSAVTSDNTKRVVATDIGQTFYVMQVKVAFADSTGNDEDIRLDQISVHYATGF